MSMTSKCVENENPRLAEYDPLDKASSRQENDGIQKAVLNNAVEFYAERVTSAARKNSMNTIVISASAVLPTSSSLIADTNAIKIMFPPSLLGHEAAL